MIGFEQMLSKGKVHLAQMLTGALFSVAVRLRRISHFSSVRNDAVPMRQHLNFSLPSRQARFGSFFASPQESFGSSQRKNILKSGLRALYT
jgi:hypothetical protein